MSLEWCLRKGLLKKWATTKDMIERELELSRINLDEAMDLRDLKKYGASIIFSYTSAFHSARSVLYRDGYSERSHACLNRTPLRELCPQRKAGRQIHVKTGRVEKKEA